MNASPTLSLVTLGSVFAIGVACGPPRTVSSTPDGTNVVDHGVTGGPDAATGNDAQLASRDDGPVVAADVPVASAPDATAPDAAMPDGGTPGPATQLTNAAGCDATDSIGPDYDEFGEWLAVRLTPPSTPFVVTGVDYQLVGNDFCDTTIAHRIEVFPDDGTMPPASPVVAASMDAPRGDSVTLRRVSVTLPTPVHVRAGQDVFVAIQMNESLCVGACRSRVGEASRNWWSNAVATPFSWSTLSSFGIDSNALVEATGHSE